jgi:hypothetical protein
MVKKKKSKKLDPGWKWGRKKRRRDLAARMIQRTFRCYLLKKYFKQNRNVIKDTFQSLKAFKNARDRNYWRQVDLNKLHREQLRLMAVSLNLPSTGKKVLLINRIQRWVDQHIIAHDIALNAAAQALQKKLRAQGAVYFCEATIGAKPFEIRPLRGKPITEVVAVRLLFHY